MDILDKIKTYKLQEIAAARRARPLAELEAAAREAKAPAAAPAEAPRLAVVRQAEVQVPAARPAVARPAVEQQEVKQPPAARLICGWRSRRTPS